MVPRDKADDFNLVGIEAAQIPVLDQVIRVLVMTGIADVDAHVVQQGAEIQPLALAIRQLVNRARLIEQCQSQLRHLRGMLRPVMTPLGQLDRAPAPDVRIAVDLRNLFPVAPDVVQDQSLAKSQIAERELVGSQRADDRVEQDGARHDQVGATRIEPRNLQPLLNADVHHPLAKPMELLGRDTQVPQIVGHAAALLGGDDGPKAQNRAGRADYAIESGRHDLLDVRVDLRSDVFHQLAFVLAADGIRSDESFREPDDAQLEALGELDRSSRAERDLDAPAADIDGHGRRPGHVDAVDSREVNQAGFFGAGDDLRPDACVSLDRRKELAAVFGLPCGACRGRQNFVYLVRVGESPEFRERLKRRRHRLRCQRTSTQTSGTEANHLLFPVDDLEGQIRVDLDHNHVDRVRPDIDGCYPHENKEFIGEEPPGCVAVRATTIISDEAARVSSSFRVSSVSILS